MNMNMNSKNKINFISADKGMIALHYTEMGVEKIKMSDKAGILASIILEQGLDDYVGGSSSLDFASEYGFKNDDDARNLLNDAYDIAGI